MRRLVVQLAAAGRAFPRRQVGEVNERKAAGSCCGWLLCCFIVVSIHDTAMYLTLSPPF